MTAQIAIFNERCVSVASDSVVTIGRGERQRTMSAAEKMFETGTGHPVVALHSGSANFMLVPYEVLIAEWRRSLNGPLATLAAYAESFGSWLTEQTSLFGVEAQDEFFSWMLDDYFLSLRGRIINVLKERDLSNEPWDSIDVMAAVDSVTRDSVAVLESRDLLSGRDADADARWLDDRTDRVSKSVEWVFDDVPHTAASDQVWLRDIPALLISRAEPWICDGTMAFVGYGADDMFPGYHSVTITGILNDQLIQQPRNELYISQSNRSGVTPFGQDEAVQTFLRAYNEQFLNAAHERLDSVLDELDLDDVDDERRAGFHESLNSDFDELSWESFIRPMLDTVESLPRADMARMAESLVGVQALRAASSDHQPTVGGPIDVVLITRTDGVQWVRRKNAAAT